MSRAWTWLSILACVAFVSAAGLGRQALCQVTFDGTANSTVRGPAPFENGNYDIHAELGRIEGRNLFHSFERFNLRTRADGTTEGATFSGPDEIRAVISRVTGGEGSDINGTIASTIPGADFYFLNPAGVVFGPNAQLDVQGSFHVSTADELRFFDGARFSASNPDNSSFTSAPPEAFGFLDRSAGSITLDRADLAVSPDESVTLFGGDVVIDRGSIFLPELFGSRNGNVTLVAMARPGAVAVADGDTSATPEGEVRMTGEGRRADGSFARDGVQVSSFGGGGVVRIRAGAFVVDGAEIHTDNRGDEPGTAMIDIVADRVRLTAGADVRSIALGQGDAGDVTVSGGELDVLSGSLLRSDTRGGGNAGAVSVLDARRVLVSRERSGRRTDISSSVGAGARGSAGSVTVDAEEITVEDSATIFSITRGAGRAGAVVLTGDSVALLAGGQVGSGTLGQSTGRGGNVTVTMTKEVVIAGQSAQINSISGMREPSGIFASTESLSSEAKRAGRVLVRAPLIQLADDGEISSESRNNDTGRAGRITIRGADRILLDGGAEISTVTGTSGGGDIRIKARDLILLRGRSRIGVDVSRGKTRAGDIDIDPRFLVLDESEISATADAGSGGRIDITADNLVISPGSEITARAGPAGIDGTVVISTPEADVSGGLVVLEGTLLDVASQLRERCAARRDIGASSFTGVGRGGLPPSPDGPLANAYVVAEGAVGEAPKTGLRPTEEAAAVSNVRLAGLIAPCVPLD